MCNTEFSINYSLYIDTNNKNISGKMLKHKICSISENA